MRRKNAAKIASRIRRIIRMLDEEIERMRADAASKPDPARRPLRAEQLN